MQTEVKEYFDTVDPSSKKNLTLLREYILTVAPTVEEKMNYNIPAYALLPNGKRDKQIIIAGYKSHVGFYPLPETITLFSTRLSKYKYRTGSIQFPNNEELPKDLILDMIQYIYNQVRCN